ncbi:MAG TPA: acyl--CoA ligase [Nocardiopsis listeri]|uniref:class I adenylate-forming enzyme family protein n=1 Tax=Nocardiopsis listeri TaxID=53440 RepID=UPI001D92BB38|nr:class I adenylate-forming enzyme family protein [Nocardiopsis listeri]HJE61392.1 acyl--CoA ligase [Nocardiopsis listeri]
MIPSKPIHLGTLFDDLTMRGSTTAVRLSRPLDIAPEVGVELDVPGARALVRRICGWFAQAGVRSGDRVAIAKRNHWDYVLLACAAARMGAVPVSLSAHLAPQALATLLRRAEPALLVTDTALLRGARDAGHDPSLHAARTLVVDGAVEGALTLDDVRGGSAPSPRRPHLDAPLAIMHTSGTTGTPKLAVHSTRTIMRRLAGFESHRWPILGSRRDDTVTSSISFAHGRALAWTAGVLWLSPYAISVITSPDLEEAGPALRLHRPTVLEAQPATLARWQRHLDQEGPREGLRNVRLFVSTFDAVHPSTVRTFLDASERRAPVWMQGWGQSETGPLTFRFLTRRSLSRRQGVGATTRDLGRPIPGRTRLRAVDPRTLSPLPPGEPGLLFCRTEALCLGYVGEEGRWRDKFVGPWWSTGDVGSIDRTGAVRLLDREVDALTEGGCLEIEDVVDERLAGVLECVVLGVAEGPPVPVVATEDGTLDLGEWKKAVEDLPTMADPMVLTWDELPCTGTGKVRRGALREKLGLPAGGRGTGRWT